MHRLVKSCIAFLPLISLSLAGCEVINPAEDLPAYISFQSPRVVVDEASGFTTDAGIRNLWLYQGGFLQGVYRVDPEIDTNGRVIPILELAKTDFFVEPGIYETGQSSYQISYRFWDRVTFNWEASPLDTLLLTPTFHYVDASQYEVPLEEHFDGGSINFQPFGSSLGNTDSTFIRLNYQDVFRGSGSGFVNFGADDRWFEMINSDPFLTTQSQDIFAEITYKNTIPFQVGLVYEGVSGVRLQPIVTVSPSGNWNTIYVHMIKEVREIINAQGPNTIFWLWIKADGEGRDGYIRFDDIRVIHQS